MRRHQLHIPRTGGSALHRLLAGTSYQYHSHQVRLKDIPMGQPVLTTLRDPVQRFLSLYAFLTRGATPRDREQFLPVEEFALDPQRAMSFLDPGRLDYLFNPQVWWVHSAEALRQRGVWVMRTERLDEEVERLGLGPLPKTGKAKLPDISDRALTSLIAFYADDLAMLGELD
jgi:hypothetical protein